MVHHRGKLSAQEEPSGSRVDRVCSQRLIPIGELPSTHVVHPVSESLRMHLCSLRGPSPNWVRVCRWLSTAGASFSLTEDVRCLEFSEVEASVGCEGPVRIPPVARGLSTERAATLASPSFRWSGAVLGDGRGLRVRRIRSPQHARDQRRTPARCVVRNLNWVRGLLMVEHGGGFLPSYGRRPVPRVQRDRGQLQV
jgi:hypothetical protein